MAIRIQRLSGGELEAAIPALSELRCQVFRDWPYLYEGDADYERQYLATFAKADHATIVAAFDADAIVGAATAAPLAGHTSEFAGVLSRKRALPVGASMRPYMMSV